VEKELNGKTLFITGGGSGIGRETAKLFAKHGAKVFIVDIDDVAGNETVSFIHAEGRQAYFQHADISKEQEVQQAVAKCMSEFEEIDFAVNNAGTIIGAKTAKYTEQDFEKVIQVNLKGTWLCMKHEIEVMMKRRKGSIVNISSIAGLIGLKNHAAYVASKHGIIGLSKTAAVEYASRGLRINTVCPGTIQTKWVGENTKRLDKLHPLGRVGQPHEIAEAVLWLCSDKASFVTGQSLVVDGGRIAGE
jgi:NAD(P)-dependent dehydrogenase (short-subunit alcohol dehydrogenase family)